MFEAAVLQLLPKSRRMKNSSLIKLDIPVVVPLISCCYPPLIYQWTLLIAILIVVAPALWNYPSPHFSVLTDPNPVSFQEYFGYLDIPADTGSRMLDGKQKMYSYVSIPLLLSLGFCCSSWFYFIIVCYLELHFWAVT